MVEDFSIGTGKDKTGVCKLCHVKLRLAGEEPRNQVGNFRSPFDFLNELLTFFLFKAAFNRFVFLRLFSIVNSWYNLIVEGRKWKMVFSIPAPTTNHLLPSTFHPYLTSQIPDTIKAVPITLETLNPSLRIRTLRRTVTNG